MARIQKQVGQIPCNGGGQAILARFRSLLFHLP
jgi:hypothetical protein